MTKHDDPDDPERKKREDDETLPLFQPPNGRAWELGQQGLERSEGKYDALVAMLVPIAQELASKAGQEGITVTEVRKEAYRRGLLDGKEGRALSSLGSLMKRAGLRNTGMTRRSDLDSTHAIRQTIWVKN